MHIKIGCRGRGYCFSVLIEMKILLCIFVGFCVAFCVLVCLSLTVAEKCNKITKFLTLLQIIKQIYTL